MLKAVKVARAVTRTALLFPSPSPVPPIGPGEGKSCQRGPDQPGAVDRVDSVTCTAASGFQT